MANPILNDNFGANERVLESAPMTVNGTIQVTGIMGLLLVASAGFVWSRYTLGYTDLALMLTGIGAIAGFITALIVTFTRNKYLVPVYTVCEGMFLGGISANFEASFPGIVTQAVAGTFAALFAMLILYRTGVLQNTDRFRSVIFTATASIAIVYIMDLIGSFFGLHVPLLNSASPAGIAISAVICIVAALNLIIDFDFIEKGAKMMLPKDYEWYGAFGLMVTIVWLYIEILRLLSKLNRK